MRICWCTIKVPPNALIDFKKSFLIFLVVSFTLEQISTKDKSIVKFAHTFHFSDQCRFCVNTFIFIHHNSWQQGNENLTKTILT